MTAACNYACTYCVPNGKKLQPLSKELSGDELINAIRLLVDITGIDKLRITGGEPLISSKFDQLLEGISSMQLKDVGVTTNGQFLLNKMPQLLASSVRRLNISLDTLDAVAFRSISRSGDLETVLSGIEAAAVAGLKVKVNTVPLRSANLDQLVPLLDYCLDRNIEIRYIELMNMGHLKNNSQYLKEFVGMNEILQLIGQKYEYHPVISARDSTSVRFAIPARGSFGVIANESEPFCRTCTRLRLSSNGQIFGCLSNSKNFSIKEHLSKPYTEALVETQRILHNALNHKQRLAFTGETTVMKFLGG